MRPSYRPSLVWLCAVMGGCVGGPTSDWPPNRSTGDSEKTPASGAAGDNDKDESPKDDKTEDEDEPSTVTKPGVPTVPAPAKDSEGKNPPSSASKDAGAPRPSLDAGSSSESLDGGTAGGLQGSDASTPSGSCTLDSDRRSVGACYGVYCDYTPGDMASRARDEGACTGASELELACDGEIARVVNECAQDEALMLGFGTSVARCARRAPSLDDVRATCVDCYVGEVLCAARNCLSACLAGDSADCSSCRLSRCGEAFRSCSGLPSPNQAARPSSSIDAGT